MVCVSELLSFMLWLVLLSEAKRANVVQKGSREQLLLCGNASLGWCYSVAIDKQIKEEQHMGKGTRSKKKLQF